MKSQPMRLALFVIAASLMIGLGVPPISTEYDWTMEGNAYDTEFGFWMDGGGDVNGDGYDDVIIGAPSYSHDFIGEGAAYIYYGSSSGLSSEPDWVMYGEHDSSGFARCVSISGDVNGDGYDDVLIGSHQLKQTKLNEGKVYFYKGGPDGPETIPSWTMVSGRKGAKLGEALSILGDINLDGYDDISVGAHGWDDDETLGDLGNKAGKAWIFLGTPDGPATYENFVEVGFTTDANIGVSLDRAGDMNGDGYMDVMIGGYIFLIGDGMLCVFRGDETGIDEDLDFMAIGGAMDTSFYAVNLSTAGDVNGDGYDDIMIGAPRFDAKGIYQSGKLHLHYGSAGGVKDEIGWIATGTQYDERWAFNVNQAGDLNQDGYDDILVGSKYYDTETMSNAGKAEVYLGGPNGPQRFPEWTFTGPDTNCSVGTNLCLAGDVNGDGRNDILVSGDEYTGDFEREGVVYAFYGQTQYCNPPQHPTILNLTPNSVTISWSWLYGAEKYKFFMKRTDLVGTQYYIPTEDTVAMVGGLLPGKSYVAYVIGKCEGGWTERSFLLQFTTPVHKEGEVEDMKIFPTIVDDHISVYAGASSGDINIRIYSSSGAMLLEKKMTVTDENATFSISEVQQLPSGNYFISVESGSESRLVRQFVKQ